MNYFHDESTAEYNRQRIIEEFGQIRLEEKALRVRAPKTHPLSLMRSIGMRWISQIVQSLTAKQEKHGNPDSETLDSFAVLPLEK